MAQVLSRLVGHRSTLQPLFEAKQGERLASTLLFSGVSGIGKRLAAQALAQALVCERGELAGCGECGACVRVDKGQSESVLVVQPEGAGIKIDQARDILQFISLQKIGRARVVILDQAHLLNPQAGNALLKSLEEPPAGTHFILITSHAAALLSTIRSRSQLVRFKPLSDDEMRQVLGPEADPWVIQSAHGSVESARKLEENRDEYLKLETLVFTYMNSAPAGLPVQEISQLRDILKDKNAQAFVAGVIQGVLRDALRVQSGVAPADARRSGAVVGATANFHPRAVQLLADLSIEMEQDFQRNVDRGLILENFAVQWRAASHYLAQ